MVYSTTGLRWFLHQPHAYFFWGMTGLAMVAPFAGAGYVIPGMSSAAMTGHHVIQRKFPHLFTTVLAGIFIADEYLVSGKLASMPWAMNQMMKADDRRNR